MLKFIEKLIKLIKGIFSKKEDIKPIPQIILPIPNSTPSNNTSGIETAIPKENDDPNISNPDSEIRSFLWKPESDHGGGVVLLVSTDEIKSTDLKVRIRNKNGNEIKINNDANTSWSKRANGLPGFKYERIHFKIGKSSKSFKRNLPILISFYIIVDGVEVDIKVMGRSFIKITDPSRRKDLT